ncbi:transketolase C-terminal domain-containing protein [Butyrivibrio sp. YAB3001]|uniref:transketolase C-terminal domain-containing protein n=1 Tax=Butyrivibrio sp. YAB3001 TaxID=1520812 RepID=UPI0008F675CB|nr:transketolase C-terminal domain-containing protein [Butyrivibrio sp. YAB3001]SFB94368.1 pyruvate dehydrogenase E1 component beta subunit [Butyrivibrio sp. YAB3001]
MKYLADLRANIERIIKEHNAYFIGEDIQEPYGGAFKVTKGLSDKYPANIIGTPMCEQGFTGLGVGMALYGCYVSVEIMFGDFITLAADQMVNHAAKFSELYKQDIHFVLRCPSGAYRGYGATHSQSLEKMFMGIPGIQVVAPSIAYSPGEVLQTSIESGVPTLFVENKLDYPRELLMDRGSFWIKKVMTTLKGFPIIKIQPVDDAPELALITYGGLSEMALKAMEKLLYEDEINIEIIIPTLISDVESIVSAVDSGPVCILEEGVSSFGWGSEIGFAIQERYGNKVFRLGARDSFIPAAQSAELEILPGLEELVNTIKVGIGL